MARFHLGLLSFGVFLVIVAVWMTTFLLTIITAENLVPLILLSSGVWTVVVAGFKAIKPRESGGAFSIFGWGMLLIVLGGSLYMVNTGMNPVYTVVFVLALIGILAVAAALRSSRK